MPARPLRRLAIATLAGLVALGPSSLAAQSPPASSLGAPADGDAARDAFLSALDEAAKTLDAKPADPEARARFAQADEGLRKMYEGRTTPEALTTALRALSARHPGNAMLTALLAAETQRFGEQATGSARDGAFDEALTLRRKLAREADPPHARAYVLDLAHALRDVGAVKVKAGDRGGVTLLREAADVAKGLAGKDHDPDARAEAWAMLALYAGAAQAFGDLPAKLAALQEGVDLFGPPMASAPATAKDAYAPLAARAVLAQAKLATGDAGGARTLYQQARAPAEAAETAFPDDDPVASVEFDILAGISLAEAKLGNAQAAYQAAQDLVGVTRARFTAKPSDVWRRRRLALALDGFGHSRLSANMKGEALSDFRDCAGYAREALRQETSSGRDDAPLEFVLSECLTFQSLLDADWQDASAEAVMHMQALERRQFQPQRLKMLKALTAANWKQRSQNVASGASGVKFEGGDGSSAEKAVQVKGVKTDGDGVFAVVAYLGSHFPNCQRESQALIMKDNKPLDVITCKTPAGEEKKVYFDISESFGKR